MRSLFVFLVLISSFGAPEVAFQSAGPHAPTQATEGKNVSGRWQVKFNLSGVGKKNLVFETHVEGSGTFLLLDTGPEGTAVADAVPAVWSLATNDRVNFSGEVELPLGTCCRETGTLMLKGKFTSANFISGKAIFVTSTEDENYNGFRSTFGNFNATRIPAKR